MENSHPTCATWASCLPHSHQGPTHLACSAQHLGSDHSSLALMLCYSSQHSQELLSRPGRTVIQARSVGSIMFARCEFTVNVISWWNRAFLATVWEGVLRRYHEWWQDRRAVPYRAVGQEWDLPGMNMSMTQSHWRRGQLRGRAVNHICYNKP